MSRKFTQLYTGNTIASNSGKCFKELTKIINELWVWNNTPINFPSIDINDDSDEEISKLYAPPFLVEGVEYYSNGVRYDTICYFHANVYNWSGYADGYPIEGIFYLGDKNASTGKFSKADIAYGYEERDTTGWQKDAYKTVTYTSIPKDTAFITFRKTNAKKSTSSALAISEDVATTRKTTDNSIIMALLSKLIEK